jgi:hypothetical protein
LLSMAGPLLQGLGGGMGQGADYKAQRKLEQERREAVAANYELGPKAGIGSGLLAPYAPVDPGITNPELDPFANLGAWVYDPQLQRMVRAPAQQAA